MHFTSLYLTSCLVFGAISTPVFTCNGGGDDNNAQNMPNIPAAGQNMPSMQNSAPPSQNSAPPIQSAPPASQIAPPPAGQNGTMSPPTTNNGTKYQATVTGYQICGTQGMACGLTGAPGKDPTAAMSAYLIPTYGKGNCGTCWKMSNPRGLNYHDGQVPTIGAPLNSPQGNGMVVMINNACAPGGDQYGPTQIGQCTQNSSHPTDKLGSQTVLDLCSDTTAVQMMWGSPNPGLAVADIEEVDCSQWSGHKSPAS